MEYINEKISYNQYIKYHKYSFKYLSDNDIKFLSEKCPITNINNLMFGCNFTYFNVSNTISKIPDNWYIIRIIGEYYKCDEIQGVVELLKTFEKYLAD